MNIERTGKSAKPLSRFTESQAERGVCLAL